MCTGVNYTAIFPFNFYRICREREWEGTKLLFIFRIVFHRDEHARTQRKRPRSLYKICCLRFDAVARCHCHIVIFSNRRYSSSVICVSACSWQWFYEYFSLFLFGFLPIRLRCVLIVASHLHHPLCLCASAISLECLHRYQFCRLLLLLLLLLSTAAFALNFFHQRIKYSIIYIQPQRVLISTFEMSARG